jgi:hypothetical protein
VTGEKVTMRTEVWVPDARKAAPDVTWAIHERLEHAEIAVIE